MIVQVQEGQVQGVQKTSVLTGDPFYAFLGIPYAQPPIGDLRFKAPVPIQKWDDVLVASTEGSECFQVNESSEGKVVVGNEDCLYLNVYTPEAPSGMKVKKAVMVYIHGGAFYFDSGTAKIYGPDYLIGHDVIYVTLNYRLHIFGFLNTGTASCPGNAGLKDQRLALKWIKTNISSFGGDPENITIFGESAGAASVHLQMLSPLSKGLFERAIMQSGTALSPWALQNDPESVARRFGRLAGYRGQDLEGLVEYLRHQPGRHLCELAQKSFLSKIENEPTSCFSLEFLPSVEKIKDGAFLPESPENLLKSATPIPTIIGMTDQEGILKLLFMTREFMDVVMNDLSILVKDNFNVDASQQVELVKQMKTFYFQNEPPSSECIPRLVDLFSDILYMKFYEAIDYLIRSNTPPYIYLFAHDGKSNFIKKKIAGAIHPDLSLEGACHADDLGYLFSQTRFPCEMDEADVMVVNHMCTLWTNFAKTGCPTPSLEPVDWRPHTIDRPCYLRIEKQLKILGDKLFGERLTFWKKWSTYAPR